MFGRASSSSADYRSCSAGRSGWRTCLTVRQPASQRAAKQRQSDGRVAALSLSRLKYVLGGGSGSGSGSSGAKQLRVMRVRA